MRRSRRETARLENFVSADYHHGARETKPKVVIIIPTRDKQELLFSCIESIKVLTAYENYEIVVINNGSVESQTLTYLDVLRSQGIKVLDYSAPFNFSKIINFGVLSTDSDLVCVLNNDTQIMQNDWLSELVDHACQPGVGVVGSKLLFSDGTIQHAGIALGFTGLAGHAFAGLRDSMDTNKDCHEVAAVTFACAVFRRRNFEKIGPLDETLAIGLNDVDYCIRSVNYGFTNIICKNVSIIHHESKSRLSTRSFRGGLKAVLEILRFLKKHPDYLKREIYFN